MTKKQTLRKQADRLWFKRHLKKKCEVCGEPAIQCHHFYYKSNYGHLRYDEDNAISLCRGCHFLLHHQDPKRIEEKIIEKRGKKWYNNLKKKAYTEPKGSYQTIKYYEDIIKELQ